MDDKDTKEVEEIVSCAIEDANQGRRKGDGTDTYRWAITALIGALTFSLAMLIQDERFMTRIQVNTYRLDVIEKNYPEQFAKINDLMIANNAKLDVLAAALKQHELIDGRGK